MALGRAQGPRGTAQEASRAGPQALGHSLLDQGSVSFSRVAMRTDILAPRPEHPLVGP